MTQRIRSIIAISLAVICFAINVYIRIPPFDEYTYCCGEAVCFLLLYLALMVYSHYRIGRIILFTMFVLVANNLLDEIAKRANEVHPKEMFLGFIMPVYLIWELVVYYRTKHKSKAP